MRFVRAGAVRWVLARSGAVRHGRRGWFGAIWLGPVGFFRQARSDLVFSVQVGLDVVQRGRLGEVGIGVVCKVLSGRQGGVRSYWVRLDRARFGVAGEVWHGLIKRGWV